MPLPKNLEPGISESYVSEILHPFPEIYPLNQLVYWVSFLESVDRIAIHVEWLSEVLPGNWSSPEWRNATLKELKSKLNSQSLVNVSPFRGGRIVSDALKTGLFSAILDKEPRPVLYIEQLSAALIMTVLYLHTNRELNIESKIRDIASAIRSLRAKRVSNVLGCLRTCANCKTPFELSKMLVPESGVMVSFTDQWNRHVVPALQILQKMKVVSVPGPIIAPPIVEGMSWDDIEDDEDVEPRIDIDYFPANVDVQIEIGEPPPDVCVPIYIVDINVDPGGLNDDQIEIYRAGQRIWSDNPLLIQTHSSILPVSTYRSVINALLDGLETLTAQNEKNALLAFLFSGLTGRAEQALEQIWVAEKVDNLNKLDEKVWVCLTTGCLYQSATIPVSAFRADESNQEYLEPTHNAFGLPLPIRLVEVLRKNKVWNGQLFDKSEKTKNLLFDACRWVSNRIGHKVCRAEFRKAFAPAVYATCRDLPLVMHICSDTQGLSSAPLYYYAPLRENLVKAYKATLNEQLGLECVDITNDMLIGRVGSQLLLKQGEDWEIGTFLKRQLQQKQDSSAQIARVHNDIVNHLVSQLIFIVGHRVCDAVYLITLGDIELEFGCAIFSDKKVDVAHDTRLVGMPPIVVNQLRLYISHLNQLSKLMPRHSMHIKKLLNGERPLLFELDNNGEHCIPSISMWKDGLNPKKPSVPLNWARTHIRTRGVEKGGDPEVLTIQLGHLEAVGYPFSVASPTEPLVFLELVNPVLQSLAQDSGWRLRTGLKPINKYEDIKSFSLTNWDSRVKAHDEKSRGLERQKKVLLQVGMKSVKSAANDLVLNIIRRDHPDLAEAISSFSKLKEKKTIAPTKEQVDDWHQRIAEVCKGDITLKTASRRILRLVLKRVRRYLVGSFVLPPYPISLSRPMDTPFIHGMMSAVRQIQLIRQHFDAPGNNIKDANTLFARVAIGLVAAGHIDSVEKIIGLLKNRNKARPITNMHEYVLVPYGEQNHEVTGLYGYAAICIARLASKYPDDPVPCLEHLEVLVAQELPDGMVGNQKTALTDLCSTMSVNNRLELSPMARMSLSGEPGSRAAPIDQQVAFLENKQFLTSPEICINEIKVSENNVSTLKIEKNHTTNWKTSYQALLDIIPLTNRDAKYILANHHVAMAISNTSKAYKSTIHALNIYIDNPLESRNVRILAIWVRDMLINGTKRRQKPAFSTVMTYLTAIAAPIMAQLNGVYLGDVTDTELDVIYQSAIESRARTHQSDIARGILNFHECLMRELDFPEIDQSTIAIYLSDRQDCVDNQILLPCHAERALNSLQDEINKTSYENINEDSATYRRSLSLTHNMLSVIHASGARVGEFQGAKLLDLFVTIESALIRINSNKHRRLKTSNARRIVDFSHRMDYLNKQRLTSWSHSEKSTMPQNDLRIAFLMSSADSRKMLGLKAQVYKLGLEFLRKATGRQSERIHRLRHLVVMESFILLCIHPDYRNTLSHLNSMLAPVNIPINGMLLPWHLHSQTELIGQASPMTALRSYFHIPWILKSTSDYKLKGLVNRRSIAKLFGVTKGSVDQVFNGCDSVMRISRLLEVIRDPGKIQNSEEKSSLTETKNVPYQLNHSQVSFKTIYRFFNTARKFDDIESAAQSFGIHPFELNILIKSARLLKVKSGFDLLSVNEQSSHIRKVRLYDAFSDLEVVLDWLDDSKSKEFHQDIFDMANELFEWGTFKSNFILKFSNEELPRFTSLLKRMNYDLIFDNKNCDDLLSSVKIIKQGEGNLIANRYFSALFATIFVGQSIQSRKFIH